MLVALRLIVLAGQSNTVSSLLMTMCVVHLLQCAPRRPLNVFAAMQGIMRQIPLLRLRIADLAHFLLTLIRTALAPSVRMG